MQTRNDSSMRLPKTIGKLLFSASSRPGALARLLLAAMMLCFGGSSACWADSAPDWLAAASRVDLGHFGAGSGAVVVGEWTDFAVDSTGKVVMTERRALRVLHLRSAEPYLKAVGFENNDFKVMSIQTWT